jgi:hypothetical protein
MRVPEVLLSGDHEKIALWREAEALRITQRRRPELVAQLFSEATLQHPGISLQKVVEPTFSFEKTCDFYRKLTGVTPQIEGGRATFFWEGVSLSFIASNVEVTPQSLLYLELPPGQFNKAFRWWSEKMSGVKQPLLTGTFLCTDPDGRTVFLLCQKIPVC